jgi:putative ABC transport system substrate-binding protein
MDRRRFLVTSLAGAVTAPLVVEAQQTSINMRQVGWLAVRPLPQLIIEFRGGMRGLGYAEGRDYSLHERYASGVDSKLAALAGELVRMRMDVIVAEAIGPAKAAQRATQTIPIVFITGDPVVSRVWWKREVAHSSGW